MPPSTPRHVRSTEHADSFPRRRFPAGGTKTCLCFWSDLCSLGHDVDALLPAGRRSGSELLELAAPRGSAADARSGHRSAGHARHDLRGGALRRRRDHGRRPPRDFGKPDQPPGDGEGVPRRPPLRHRDRRRGRACARDGQALPAAARALREGRGWRAQPRRQGEPAQPDGPVEPARGDARPRRRPDLRGIRHAAERGPPLHLRRHRRPLRGA